METGNGVSARRPPASASLLCFVLSSPCLLLLVGETRESTVATTRTYVPVADVVGKNPSSMYMLVFTLAPFALTLA